jgi:hypothetical protein
VSAAGQQSSKAAKRKNSKAAKQQSGKKAKRKNSKATNQQSSRAVRPQGGQEHCVRVWFEG